METRVAEIAERIRGLREMMDMTPAEVATAVGVSEEEYLNCENAKTDFNFTFLYKCADLFGVDITELLTGENPHLSFYSVVRKGEGLDISRRAGFLYEHLGYRFKNKLAEPFVVTAPYLEVEQNQPIHLSTHKGQEFDYILKGSLMVELDGHLEVLHEGDSIYYDSGRKHGMIATDGEECVFIAVVLKEPGEKAEYHS